MMSKPYDLFWSEPALALAGYGLGPVRARIVREVEDIVAHTEGNRFATSAVTEAGHVFYCDAALRHGRWRVEVRRGRLDEGPRLPGDAPGPLAGKTLLMPAPDDTSPAAVPDAAARSRFLA